MIKPILLLNNKLNENWTVLEKHSGKEYEGTEINWGNLTRSVCTSLYPCDFVCKDVPLLRELEETYTCEYYDLLQKIRKISPAS